MMTIFSCSDFGLRSRKKENRAEYPPAKMFKGDGLLAAQKMFDGDLSGMEQVIKEKKIDINTCRKKQDIHYSCMLLLLKI